MNYFIPPVMIPPQIKSQSCNLPKSIQKLKGTGRRMFLSKNRPDTSKLPVTQRVLHKNPQTLITRSCTAVPFPPSTPRLPPPPPPPPHQHPCPPPLSTKRQQRHPLLLASLTAPLLQANFKGASLHFSRMSLYLKWNKS